MNLNKVKVPGQKATIILTAFPGRTAQDDFSIEEMQRVLDYLENQNCDFFISLVQDQEFEEFCSKSVFVEELMRRPLTWLHFPILDMGVPDKDMWSKLDNFRPSFVNSFKSGNSIAIHCKGGLGRSGMIAAMILFDLGFTPQDAIDHVRSFRAGAIETKAQEKFIKSLCKVTTYKTG